MTQATPELISYAATITKERGIQEHQMTPALMIEILKEAVRRMSAIGLELVDGKTTRAKKMRSALNTAIYMEVVSREALAKLEQHD